MVSHFNFNLMANLINLTPHSINVLDAENNVILTIPSDGVARCTKSSVTLYPIPVEGIDSYVNVNAVKFGDTTGLPDPQINVAYIVSVIVAQANPNRHDLLVVDEVVRSADGSTVLGCRAFSKV